MADLSGGQASRTHQWQDILDRLGVSLDDGQAVLARARANATPFLAELVASRLVSEDALYRQIAADLEIPYLEEVDPSLLLMSEDQQLAALRSHGAWQIATLQRPGRETGYLLAPVQLDLAGLRLELVRKPALAARLFLVAPSTLRRAIMARAEPALSRAARSGLFEHTPQFSARFVANAWQGVVVGILAVVLPWGLLFHTRITNEVVHVVMTLFFLSCVVLRVFAMSTAQPLRLARLERPRPHELPVYSVLVALYREAHMVPQLLAALDALEWPRARLEVKLVCERDDAATIAALRSRDLPPWIEVIEVPPGGPRTKPNALAYALPTCGGEFVVLYDAEDRPHAFQLVEAYQRFRADSAELACLQAPLVVTNGRANILARMFAFEYAGLFRGLLPWLSRGQRFLPLGGTSNHFRREALVAVGGWDPHNVTEDADLGLRLLRFGYRTQTITRPTFEEAPDSLKSWLLQRSRWLKGWLQTWLVHMRSPRALYRDVGPVSFLLAQVIFLGMIMSALVHPIFLATILYLGAGMVSAGSGGPYASTLFFFDIMNISLGYAAFIGLGGLTLLAAEKRHLWKVVLFTPVYWLMMSAAACLALFEIFVRPHHWHKTPHNRIDHAHSGDGQVNTRLRGRSDPPL